MSPLTYAEADQFWDTTPDNVRSAQAARDLAERRAWLKLSPLEQAEDELARFRRIECDCLARMKIDPNNIDRQKDCRIAADHVRRWEAAVAEAMSAGMRSAAE